MIVSLFGGTVLRPGMEDAEAEVMERLDPILRSMPGFISYKDYAADDGEGIAIARFTTREALDAWVRQPDHVEVQKIAHEIYESLWVQTCETYREATYVNGKRTDGDLSHLFVER